MKALTHKAYGSIPHLLGSRRGPGDKGVNEGQHRICTEKKRDKKDRIIVTEKLDGSCCCVANINGEIVAVTRSGFAAESSPYKMHHVFHEYVADNLSMYKAMLPMGGMRLVGEWLWQAHGTLYNIPYMRDAFVAFDLYHDKVHRMIWDELVEMCSAHDHPIVPVLSDGPAISIEIIDVLLGAHGFYRSMDYAEGAVWQVERDYSIDFKAKYVRDGKVDGRYLPGIGGAEDIINVGRCVG